MSFTCRKVSSEILTFSLFTVAYGSLFGYFLNVLIVRDALSARHFARNDYGSLYRVSEEVRANGVDDVADYFLPVTMFHILLVLLFTVVGIWLLVTFLGLKVFAARSDPRSEYR